MADLVVTHELTTGWSFKQTDDDGSDAWMTVQHVPTVVHLDLLEHKKYCSPRMTLFKPSETMPQNP